MVCAVEEIEVQHSFGGKGGKCDQGAPKSNSTTQCLNSFVAHCSSWVWLYSRRGFGFQQLLNGKSVSKPMNLGHPQKMFRFSSPDRPIFFGKVKKKIRITCKEASTLVYKHTTLSYQRQLS